VKNSSILEGFVYTFKGGKLSDVDKPAETVLGYIEGPGGRAVAYLDGHVKWVPN
jgi:prepilin-type processing-associated H-X9-DG protein